MLNKELLPKIVNNFLDKLLIDENKSNNTVENYGVDLLMFFRFMKLHKKGTQVTKEVVLDEKISLITLNEGFIKRIQEEDVEAYLRYLALERENNPSSRTRKIMTLKKFYKYLIAKKIVKVDITENISSPKKSKKKPIFLSVDDSKKLLSSIDDSNRFKKRDQCIFTLFLNCGLRNSELRNIKIKDIDFTNNLLRIKKGKGDKERFIGLNKTCINTIKTYLTERQDRDITDRIKKEEDIDILFISSFYQQMSISSIEKILNKYLERAGLDGKGISPHKLRHTYATIMYSNGIMDMFELQEVLGHSSVLTTQMYAHITTDVLKSKMERNPLNE